MNPLSALLRASPARARVLPFAIILALTFAQESFVGPLRYWLYLAKMLVGVWCILAVRSVTPEVRWAFSWEAVAVGVIVCIVWVGLDPYYAKLQAVVKDGLHWDPAKEFG